MDFALSADQTLIRDTVRSYCENHYRFTDRLAILRSPEGFSRAHWTQFAKLGWLGVTLPEDVGGFGGSPVELAIILEAFGHDLVVEPFVPCALLAGQVLNLAGSETQRQTLLTALVRGELLPALAHFESDARGDPRLVGTRAVALPGGRYRLNGRKPLVLAGAGADLLIVSARTSGAAHEIDGVSLFLVRPDAPGLSRRAFRTFDGGTAAEIELTHVDVEADARLGREGEASLVLEEAIDGAILGLCAEAVGVMDRVVIVTRDFLKTRRAYGTTLSTFQALQHRLADMFVELELSRSMLFRLLAAFAQADRRARHKTVSAAKALIGRAGRFVGAQGVQLHGGMGMADDYVIGHAFKRLSVIETLFGNSEYHLTHHASLSRGVVADVSPLAGRPVEGRPEYEEQRT